MLLTKMLPKNQCKSNMVAISEVVYAAMIRHGPFLVRDEYYSGNNFPFNPIMKMSKLVHFPGSRDSMVLCETTIKNISVETLHPQLVN